MKILIPVDGSAYTKKALAFLVTHEGLAGAAPEILVLHVQPPMPPRVKTMVGAAAVRDYQREESEKVLQPVDRFLRRHGITAECRWVAGHAGEEIVRAAARDKAQMIVMGTHGHGLVGRALMGSVAQRVVTDCTVPVLLVK
ncbi:universal stress protein [Caenimonas sedimenti]|uniref:Universal stress protein n=1 Tax=Caenimonas sedimenti TaxID=2596921 RepID=A0A562ZWE9_9BURK|nr:universal stress protein [Caenimonas sedimenti]TWO72687.1 universal stress protein [Caenimonas sedimenti]